MAGRSVFGHGAVVIGADRDRLLAGLDELAGDDLAGSVIRGTATAAGKTVFVFPGQGSQWLGMGRRVCSIPRRYSRERFDGVRGGNSESSTGR